MSHVGIRRVGSAQFVAPRGNQGPFRGLQSRRVPDLLPCSAIEHRKSGLHWDAPTLTDRANTLTA